MKQNDANEYVPLVLDHNSDQSLTDKAKVINTSESSKTALETCPEPCGNGEGSHVSNVSNNGSINEEVKEELKEEDCPELADEGSADNAKEESMVVKPRRRRNRVNKVYAITNCPHKD